MEYIFNFLKYLGLFFIFIIVIAIFISLLELTGLNSIIINKLGIILTALSFFIISAKASNEQMGKGYILGLKLGLSFIIFLIIINLILFQSKFNLDRFIYYIILISSGILGGSFGKNFNFKLFAKKK